MAKVVSKDVGARENGAKTWDAWKCFPACPENKLWRRPYELEDHVGEEALSSNLPLKLGLVKRITLTFFFSHLLKKHLSRIHISLCLIILPQGGKTKHH